MSSYTKCTHSPRLFPLVSIFLGHPFFLPFRSPIFTGVTTRVLIPFPFSIFLGHFFPPACGPLLILTRVMRAETGCKCISKEHPHVWSIYYLHIIMSSHTRHTHSPVPFPFSIFFGHFFAPACWPIPILTRVIRPETGCKCISKEHPHVWSMCKMAHKTTTICT